MTDSKNLPAKITTTGIALLTEQSDSLVARGLGAVKNRNKQSVSLTVEVDSEKLYRDAIYAYNRNDYETARRFLFSLASQDTNKAQTIFDIIATMDLLHDMESRGVAIRASLFSVDKRIAKVQADIAESQDKYKAASEKANGARVSKLIQIYEERLVYLKRWLDDLNKQKADNKLTPVQMNELKDNSFKIVCPDECAWLLHNQISPLYMTPEQKKKLIADSQRLAKEWLKKHDS